MEKYLYFGNLQPANLDSVLILADKALSLENKLALAHSIKGRYYVVTANDEQASKEFEIASEFNPNDYQIYYNQGNLYFFVDNVKSLENYHKAASLLSGKDLAEVLIQLSLAYMVYGFENKGSHYAREALRLGGDSITFYIYMATSESLQGNLVSAIAYLDEAHSVNPGDRTTYHLKGLYHGFNGNYKESISCFEKFFEGVEVLGHYEIIQLHRLGFAYWQIGQKEKAKQYFDQMITYVDGIVKQVGNPMVYVPLHYYDLSGTFAFLGMKKEALEHLRQFINISPQHMRFFEGWLNELDPMFVNIREDPEFQGLVNEYSTLYQAEHEMVRQWLEENDML